MPVVARLLPGVALLPVKTTTRQIMRRTGFEELVGADAFALRVEDEVKAFAGAATPEPQPTMSVLPPSQPER